MSDLSSPILSYILVTYVSLVTQQQEMSGTVLHLSVSSLPTLGPSISSYSKIFAEFMIKWKAKRVSCRRENAAIHH